jgi:tungstate transport system substrate-binding protein
VQHEGWYVSTFADGAATLREADRRHGYTLTGPRPYLLARDTLGLRPLLTTDPALHHPYHVIRVNPQKWPGVNTAGAQAFADYLVAPETQQRIGRFGLDKYGQALFVPDAGKPEDQLGP